MGLELKLVVKGEEKTFVAPFISGRMLRKTLEIQSNTNFEDIKPETLDGMVDYAVDIFGGQFSRDEFYDGIASDKMFTTILDCCNTVAGMTNNAAGGIDGPNVRKNKSARTRA